MKIVAYSPIPHDGTSFYRGFGPLHHLARNFVGFQIIDGSKEGFEYNWHTLADVDMVFVQRPSTATCIHIIKAARLYNKPVWIDYDDDYIKIPTSNPRHNLYADPLRQAQIKECMLIADYITVSTEAIKKSIVDNVETEAEIIVIPNAYNDDIFGIGDNVTPPKDYAKKQDKLVLWRGGDTHVKDVEIYKDAILHCFESFPEYKWCFYGHQFDWMTEKAIALGQHDRLLYFKFEDIMGYFRNIMQLRPEIMIVPLEDNDFNRAKSNISWIEGTLAGAAVMTSDLPEFNKPGCLNFKDNAEFIKLFTELVDPSSKLAQKSNKLSLKNIPTLYDINQIRSNLVIRAMDDNFKSRLYKKEITVKPWDDKRFFEYALANGATQENQSYTEHHHALADWLTNELNPETVIEFGSGPGPLIERFTMNNVFALGLEINDYFIDYYKKRNPVFENKVIKFNILDFVDDSIVDIEDSDLGISIEVFEHIDMSEADWDKLISKLAKKFKHFYFTSTPYRASVKFDKQWGHVNVRPMEGWINLFERNGWKYVSNPKKLCDWDLLFVSPENVKII